MKKEKSHVNISTILFYSIILDQWMHLYEWTKTMHDSSDEGFVHKEEKKKSMRIGVPEVQYNSEKVRIMCQLGSRTTLMRRLFIIRWFRPNPCILKLCINEITCVETLLLAFGSVKVTNRLIWSPKSPPNIFGKQTAP